MKQKKTNGPNMSSDDVAIDYVFIYGIGLIATLILGTATFTYAKFGEEWVDSLDERIGEIVANRARNLINIGRNDEAIELFERALSVGFSDETHRVWVSHDLARLHLTMGQYDDAIAVSQSCINLDAENGEAFGIWHKALQQQQRTDEALNLTAQWYEWGQERDQLGTVAWAKFHEGLHLEATQSYTRALEAFEEGSRAAPEQHISKLLTDSIARVRQKLD